MLTQPSANGTERPTDWQSVNWRKAGRQVRNLRQRIFRATQQGTAVVGLNGLLELGALKGARPVLRGLRGSDVPRLPDNKRKPYSTDLRDVEWKLIAPLLPPPAKEGRPREHDMCEIVSAIYYVLDNGIKWASIPHDFPPASTVYYWAAKLRDDGVIEQAHHSYIVKQVN